MTKIGAKGLHMSSGKIRQFGSAKKRANFERALKLFKHGWKPTGKRKSKR